MALVERRLEVLDWKEPKAVGGFLTKADTIRFQDGGTGMRYMIEREGGSLAAFPGATQLDMRLSRRDLGKFVQIQYVGEDTTREMSQGRSRPKLFKVWVDDARKIELGAPETNADGSPAITDADIPF